MSARPGKKERPFAHRRRELGLSLDQAAVRLGISPRYLRALELGSAPLAWHLARRMAAEYQTTVEGLVGNRAASTGEEGGR